MTLQDIRDIFVNDYKIESLKRKEQEITFNENQMFRMINRAEQEIQRRLNVIESSTDISIVVDTQVYSLPNNFGNHKYAQIVYSGATNPTDLTEVSKKEIDQQLLGDYYSIYFDEGYKVKIPNPSTAGTLTVYYFPRITTYSPTVDTPNLTDTINLPSEYSELIILFMLAQLFNDKKEEFEYEARKFKSSRIKSVRTQNKYDIAGLDA